MTFLAPKDILAAFEYRRATREYDPTRTISAADFDFILELGRLSPSSVGSEPWKFLVIQNKALREALKSVAWGMTAQVDAASHIVAILAKKNLRYDSPFMRESMIRRGLDEAQIQAALPRYEKLQRHDMGTLDNERALFDWACKQTYLALANMMTGAAMAGIDSCPIEGFDYTAVNRILSKAGLFDPAEWGVSVMATFGYRAGDIKPRARRSKEEVVQWIK